MPLSYMLDDDMMHTDRLMLVLQLLSTACCTAVMLYTGSEYMQRDIKQYTGIRQDVLFAVCCPCVRHAQGSTREMVLYCVR